MTRRSVQILNSAIQQVSVFKPKISQVSLSMVSIEKIVETFGTWQFKIVRYLRRLPYSLPHIRHKTKASQTFTHLIGLPAFWTPDLKNLKTKPFLSIEDIQPKKIGQPAEYIPIAEHI
jgi:hypothetical protein